MRRLAPLLLLLGGGCFSARGGAEGYRARIALDMDQAQVRKAIGKPREVIPIPGQGNAPDLPVEQWRYWWTYRTGRVLTIFFTLGIGAIWTDNRPYGFDVGIGRDGKVRGVSDVAPPR